MGERQLFEGVTGMPVDDGDFKQEDANILLNEMGQAEKVEFGGSFTKAERDEDQFQTLIIPKNFRRETFYDEQDFPPTIPKKVLHWTEFTTDFIGVDKTVN